jgi:hypothetical protein
MITLSDAAPGDEAAIAALCAELDEFYGGLPDGEPAERAEQRTRSCGPQSAGRQPVPERALRCRGIPEHRSGPAADGRAV